MSELYLATMYLEQGDRENAARELERILSMDMDNIHAWRLLAHVLTNPDEIRECWDNVLRLNPRDPEAIAALKAMEKNMAESSMEGAPPPFPEEDMKALEKGDVPVFEEESSPSLEYRIASEATRPVPPKDEFAYLERNTEPRPAEREEKGFFDNDFIFYTLIVLVLLFIAVMAILLIFGPEAFNPLLDWLQKLLPAS